MSERIEMDSLDFVGDLKKGRPTLGNLMRVSVYRLLVYSMKAVLTKELGKVRADKLFYSVGMLDHFPRHFKRRKERFQSVR